MSRRCALFGHPVAHSPAPRMHRLFAHSTGADLDYETWDVPAGGLADALRRFREQGGSGANVTLPLKQEAFELCGQVAPAAELAGAVNTLLWSGDGWRGDNTDGVGFMRDLSVNLEIAVTDRRVLIAGAGGAARGIAGPLLELRPAALVVANRDAKRAHELAGRFEHLTSGEYATLAQRGPFDLVINATSAGHQGQPPPLPDDELLADGGCCYDLSYGAVARPFQAWAREHGAARFHDGVGMLVEQGAESFFIWTGRRPETAGVIEAMRQAVG